MHFLSMLTIAALGLTSTTPLVTSSAEEAVPVTETVVGSALAISAPDGSPSNLIEAFCPGGRWYKFGGRVPLDGTYTSENNEICVSQSSGSSYCRTLVRVGDHLFLELTSGTGAPLSVKAEILPSNTFC